MPIFSCFGAKNTLSPKNDKTEVFGWACSRNVRQARVLKLYIDVGGEIKSVTNTTVALEFNKKCERVKDLRLVTSYAQKNANVQKMAMKLLSIVEIEISRFVVLHRFYLSR